MGKINEIALLTLKVAEVRTLKAKLAEGESVIWESKNPSIAKVSNDGVVKCLKAGVTTITLKSDNGEKSTITVRVNN